MAMYPVNYKTSLPKSNIGIERLKRIVEKEEKLNKYGLGK